jgi:hypothetical protein
VRESSAGVRAPEKQREVKWSDTFSLLSALTLHMHAHLDCLWIMLAALDHDPIASGTRVQA